MLMLQLFSDAGSQAPFMKRLQNYKHSKTNNPAKKDTQPSFKVKKRNNKCLDAKCLLDW